MDLLKLRVQNLEWDNQQKEYWIEKYKEEKQHLQLQIGTEYLDEDQVKRIMYDKFQLILNQIQLDIPTLRYIISSRKVFESLDILG